MKMLKMKYAVLLLILLPVMILWERCSSHEARNTTFLPIRLQLTGKASK